MVSHSLRGLNATLRTLGGASRESVANGLGHESFRTTSRYYLDRGAAEQGRWLLTASTSRGVRPAGPKDSTGLERLVPGVSRSGITILAAMAIGLRRDAAARFSFLLSIPAIAGAGIFEMKHLIHSDVGALPFAVGLLLSTITGYASIAWLLRFLRTRTMLPFVIYRIALGATILALLAAGLLRA